MIALVALANIAVGFLRQRAREHSQQSAHAGTTGTRTAAVLSSEQELLEHRQIIREVFVAQRAAIRTPRDSGEIGEAVLRRIERDLDTEERQMMASVGMNGTRHQCSSQRPTSAA